MSVARRMRLALGVVAGLCCALAGVTPNPLRAETLAPAGPV